MGRALVVGAAGQVGNQIVELLGGDRVVRSGRMPREGWTELDLERMAGRVREAIDLMEGLRVDAVFCVGGMTDVEGCERNAELAMATNCHGPATLAEAAARLEIPFVYFSTEYVFDGRRGPYVETDAMNPLCAYGESKARGEREIARVHGCALMLRTTVVYGPDPGEKNFLYGLERACAAGRSFRVPQDQVSTPTYNRDLAAAAVGLAEAGAGGIFHVCGPERLNRLEFALRAGRELGLNTEHVVGVATAELGQAARRPLDAGLTSAKLLQTFPELRMRGLSEAIADWKS